MGEITAGTAIYEVKSQGALLWEEIYRCKERFFQGNEDPRMSSYVKPEVAESWVRSRKYGVDPYLQDVRFRINQSELKALMQDKQTFLETTKQFSKKMWPLLRIPNKCISLSDANGVVLFLYGDNSVLEFHKSINALPGTIFAEDSVGTTCLVLCLKFKKTIQLHGLYNYCRAFQNNIASSTPILDDNGNLVAAITLVHRSNDNVFPEDVQRLCLDWVSSLGVIVENQLNLQKRVYSLGSSNALLKATLTAVDQGLIIVDKTGKITKANNTGATLVGGKVEEVVGKHYTAILGDHRGVARALHDGKPIEEVAVFAQGGSQYRLNVQPVIQDNEHLTSGAVIRISPFKTLSTQQCSNSAKYTFDDLLGTSTELRETINRAERFAKLPHGVLLIGESGVGKEIFAQAIHNSSQRQGPFLAINCASIPKELIESELFGYEGGAFTGAERKGRIGKIELANGGTLFLDEIGDMPLELQTVFLRVLEDKQVMRVGGMRFNPVDFRVIAATNKDLNQLVRDNKFRSDLYFRLEILRLTIPPLRSRGEDVILLAKHFIKDFCRKFDQPEPALSIEAQRILMEYDWPGNVRELANTMIYAVNMSDGHKVIDKPHLPDKVVYNRYLEKVEKEPVLIEDMEKKAIIDALKLAQNNVRVAAKTLGISTTTIYRKIKEYDILLKK